METTKTSLNQPGLTDASEYSKLLFLKIWATRSQISGIWDRLCRMLTCQNSKNSCLPVLSNFTIRVIRKKIWPLLLNKNPCFAKRIYPNISLSYPLKITQKISNWKLVLILTVEKIVITIISKEQLKLYKNWHLSQRTYLKLITHKESVKTNWQIVEM